MSLCAPREILRAFLQVVLLAVERLDVAGPVLAVDALHRLALVLGVDGHELALLPSVPDERNRRQRQRTDMRVEILAWRFSRRRHKENIVVRVLEGVASFVLDYRTEISSADICSDAKR